MFKKSMYVLICTLIFTVVLLAPNGFATEKALAATSTEGWHLIKTNYHVSSLDVKVKGGGLGDTFTCEGNEGNMTLSCTRKDNNGKVIAFYNYQVKWDTPPAFIAPNQKTGFNIEVQTIGNKSWSSPPIDAKFDLANLGSPSYATAGLIRFQSTKGETHITNQATYFESGKVIPAGKKGDKKAIWLQLGNSYGYSYVYEWKEASPATPATPSMQNLRATAGNKQVCLTWSAAADKKGLIGYHLFRGTGSGKETTTPVTDFPIKDTSYNDPNVLNGTTYCYTMRPVYSSGMGTVSNEACATPSATAACGGQKASGSGNPILPNGIGTIILSINNPYMTVNGAQREIDPGRGTVPIVYNGRTLLPIAAVIEAAGGTVKWLAAEKKVTIEQKGTIIDLWIDKNETLINGKPGMTDVAPIIKNSRTMLPLRFIADNLGAKVDWDGVSYKVTIQFK